MTPEERQEISAFVEWLRSEYFTAKEPILLARLLADYDRLVEVARAYVHAEHALDVNRQAGDSMEYAIDRGEARIALRALIDPATRPWQDAADAEMRAAVDASAQAARTALATPEPVEGEPDA